MSDTNSKMPDRAKESDEDQELEAAPPTRPGRITTDRGPGARRTERDERHDRSDEPHVAEKGNGDDSDTE